MRDDGKGGLVINEVRDCYREVEFDEEFEEQMKAQGAHYIKAENKIYILGNDAYLQAGMAELSAGFKGANDMLQRPMKDGVLNPDAPKISLSILRELQKACIERGVGPARPGEVLYFSVPANPVDSEINNVIHAKMAERYLNGLGYDAHALGEGLAVVFAENPKMHTPAGDMAYTGIGISFGAGMANVCLAERGTVLDEYSIARSGDWLDAQVSRMTGQPKTKVTRIKERKLNFDNVDETDKDGEILVAYDIYYDELVKYVFDIFTKRFNANKGAIDNPIDIVLSGGTASPAGFDKKVRRVLYKMSLPFEIGDIKMAGGGETKKMLQAVAKGCYIRAKQAAKKAATKEDLSEVK
jgi:hypothetical protein